MSRLNVHAVGEGTRLIGIVTITAGGFWRGYSLTAGVGYGPFPSEDLATAWVRKAAAAARARRLN